MTSISKNVYIDKLDDIVKEYSKTYHTTIKMKPIDVIDFVVENNDKNPKSDDSDHARISKYIDIFVQGCTPSRSQQVFVIKKVKNIVL